MTEHQCPSNPAEVYDARFVPALFGAWASRVADAAAVAAGDRVLDVGCGTGVLACVAAERVGDSGGVVGLDANPQMLAVAQRKARAVRWQQGRAEALPYPAASFDAVISQAAFMFFEPAAAAREMLRVLRPSGRLAVQVFARLEQATAYHVLTERLTTLFGPRYGDAMRPPFALGDERRLVQPFIDAGARELAVRTEPGPVRFASIDDLIATERACLWTLGGLLDARQFGELRRDALSALARYVRPDGTVQFDCPGHIVTARAPVD